jgi:hypothetical protein
MLLDLKADTRTALISWRVNSINRREHRENDTGYSFSIRYARRGQVQMSQGGMLERLGCGIDVEIDGIQWYVQCMQAGTSVERCE